MLLRRADRRTAAAVAALLAVTGLGAILTAPSEYPVSAFLLPPLVAALVADQRVTAVVTLLATGAGAMVAFAGTNEGAALWFRLAFLALAGATVVVLAGLRRTRGEQEAIRNARLLRRSEQRYRSLVEATSSIVWTVTEDGRFTERHVGWEHYTGQRWPEYADHGWLTAIHPEDRERFVTAWLRARAELHTDDTDCRLWNDATQAYRYVEARGVPIVEGGEVREWVGTVTDVHDRMEAILRASADAQLRTAVLRSLKDGVFVATADGTIVDVNDAWPRIFGYAREHVLGASPPYEWWPDPASHPDEAAAIEAMGAIFSDDSEGGEYEVTFLHEDGYLFPALVTVSLIRDEDDHLSMIVGTVKDITRHVRAEARLRVIADLTARLSSANDLADVGEASLAELLKLLECPHGAVFVIDGQPAALSLVAESGLSRGTRERWSRLPLDLHAPAVDAVHTQEPMLVVEQRDFIARYPGLAEYMRALDYHTTLNMPLLQGDSVVGVLFFAFDRRRPLGSDEMELLRTIGPILAQALDRARLFEFQRSIASTLQRAMLTEQPVAPTNVTVAARYVPAVAELSVGGDWYDVIPIDDTRVAIAVGDIVGRGINAAAAMGQLRSALSAIARTTDSAVEAVARLDRFAHGVEGARATTLAYGIVDSADGTLRYTSAGHPPVLVVDTDETVTFLQAARGWPLGVTDPDRARPEAVAILPPGSTIVLYTDGLVERRTERLEDGLERLAGAAAARAALPVEQLCDELLDELVTTGHADDVALVALRLTGATPTSFTSRVPAVPAALSHVRGEMRAWLAAQGLPAPQHDDMVLAVGEACSNAIEHAYPGTERDTLVVEGFRRDGRLVFTVRDYGCWRPLVPNPERNRGLRLMHEVTDGMKISSTRHGGTLVEMQFSALACRPLG